MYCYTIRGIVQGVGFRPYIYRTAVRYALRGSVRNRGSYVEVLVNDPCFEEKLLGLPPIARIDSIEKSEADCPVPEKFTIVRSAGKGGAAELPADLFMCDDCKQELCNPSDRRHKYYFITCTNCGPRFSMIRDVPYDRPKTSMGKFPMCARCTKEYTDPLNRRYHAQTIACKDCGPRLRFYSLGREETGQTDEDTVARAVSVLKAGGFVSVKGVGGFHIACIAQKGSVQGLRTFLGRMDKPFALMAATSEMAKRYCRVSAEEERVLYSAERPIVVLRKKKPCLGFVSELDSLGVMLPYTALHHLIMEHFSAPLVMTSCNMPGEPVETQEGLGPHILTHERGIVNRCDDSVVLVNRRVFYLRRSRGFVPRAVSLPFECADTLALGAGMSNTVCVAIGRKAFLSQYIGQTDRPATAAFMEEAAQRLLSLTRAKPKIVACDLHPGYASTQLARRLASKYGASLVRVQHHRAHVAACAAEHGLSDYTGIAMDGLGYGDDGSVWGGEVFRVRDRNFERIGSLQEQPQIGSDSAAYYPKKMLFGILAGIIPDDRLCRTGLFPEKESRLLLAALRQGFNIVRSSSTGRVLDSAAALAGLCSERTYEGRPAMLLESAAGKPAVARPKIAEGRVRRLDTSRLFKILLGVREPGVIGATAQMYIARGLYGIAKMEGMPIVFSGGVAYNRMISGYLMRKGCLSHREVPCGDGGISYGQAVVANIMR